LHSVGISVVVLMYGLTSALVTEANRSTTGRVDSSKDVTIVDSLIVRQITKRRSECKDNGGATLTATVIRKFQEC
jgi:hypothetical protein